MCVERVLPLTDSSDLKKFSFNIEVTDFARVEGWVCTVVRGNVVELDFFFMLTMKKHTLLCCLEAFLAAKPSRFWNCGCNFVFLLLMLLLLHSVFQVSSHSMFQMLFLVLQTVLYLNI